MSNLYSDENKIGKNVLVKKIDYLIKINSYYDYKESTLKFILHSDKLYFSYNL
jgi:hypothetical protein